MSTSVLFRRLVFRRGVSSGSFLSCLAALVFLMLVVAPAQAQVGVRASNRAGSRVVTNKELERFRLRREAQEKEYERTRHARGMPSRQEVQQRIEETDRRLRELAQELEAERLEAELQALRAELAVVRRQLGELNLQLSQPSVTYGPADGPLSYYPYYLPSVSFINDLSFGRRHRFGHRGFGLNLNFGKGLHHPRRQHAPPIEVSPARRAAARPPVTRAPWPRC
jgi:hypothetical protein